MGLSPDICNNHWYWIIKITRSWWSLYSKTNTFWMKLYCMTGEIYMLVIEKIWRTYLNLIMKILAYLMLLASLGKNISCIKFIILPLHILLKLWNDFPTISKITTLHLWHFNSFDFKCIVIYRYHISSTWFCKPLLK